MMSLCLQLELLTLRDEQASKTSIHRWITRKRGKRNQTPKHTTRVLIIHQLSTLTTITIKTIKSSLSAQDRKQVLDFLSTTFASRHSVNLYFSVHCLCTLASASVFFL